MAIGKRAVVDAVLRGISAGNAKYEKITWGSWITDSGAEGFMAAHVAEALSGALGENGSLLVEAPFADIREWSGAARRRGRPLEVLRGRRRADIALFDRQGRSTHAVELKRAWNRRDCYADLEKLGGLLHACAAEVDGSLKYGLLGLLIVETDVTWKSAREKVQSKAKSIEADVRSDFGFHGAQATFRISPRMRRYPEIYEDEKEWAAASFCIALSS